ncbi:MAG: hypothetical protein HY813_03400 [Candidatus Portnoybacteria bacterium]|nr:hypothetical protein [Candidatus Portnoybacteria bacterium]
MILPSRNYLYWIALLIATTISISVSLWGYHQIINIPPPTTLEIKRLPKTIFIDSPTMNERIANPIRIVGRARSETSAIIATLLDKNGVVLRAAQAPVKKNELTPFEIEIKYEKPNTDLGLITITQSPFDKENPTYKKSILVKFSD